MDNEYLNSIVLKDDRTSNGRHCSKRLKVSVVNDKLVMATAMD